MAHLMYYPEMREEKPKAQIEARLAHYGRHWFLKTPLELKGQGIEFLGKMKASELVESAQHKVGWNQYKVTDRAFNKLCEKHDICSELLL